MNREIHDPPSDPTAPGTLRLDVAAAAVFACDSRQLRDWALAGGLDPAVDFRRRDLRGLSFVGQDVGGFDFTGSLVDDGAFDGARCDATTTLPAGVVTRPERAPRIETAEWARVGERAKELYQRDEWSVLAE